MSTHPSTSATALKEWAVTVRALAQGRQLFLLRKGGIREDGNSFEVPSQEFLLYPTYEHQSTDQLKDDAQEDLATVLTEAPSEGTLTFSHWAQVREMIELDDEEVVGALSPYHIWTADYAQKRLRWRPRSPLLLMLLRVYRLPAPASVPYLAQYGGCRSWVRLEHPVDLGHLSPVLSDQEFERMVGQVKGAVGSRTPTS